MDLGRLCPWINQQRGVNKKNKNKKRKKNKTRETEAEISPRGFPRENW